ncbi:hypothetical protein [Candidatus Hodarchaeum mangrovi]
MFPIKKDVVIKQLVEQQFYQPPNYIVDRTHRIKTKVMNSDLVINKLVDFLFFHSKHLKGTESSSYLEISDLIAQKLGLNPKMVRSRFHTKTNGFILEHLETEDLIFITMIASILEIFDLVNYQETLEAIKKVYLNQYQDQETSLNESNIVLKFEEGIKRLGEVANSDFSILQNLIKVQDLASVFGVQINIDQDEFNEFIFRVVDKIICEGY